MVKKSEAVNASNDPGPFASDWGRSGMVNHSVKNPEFTGVARSLVCYYNQGHNNFRIHTLYIEKGKVVKADISDAYMLVEALAKIELWNDLSAQNLNNKWKDGKALEK